MKTTTFLFLLLLLVAAGSCNKDKEDFLSPAKTVTSTPGVASSSTNQLAFPSPNISYSRISTGIYFIYRNVPGGSNLVFDVPSGSNQNGTIIQQYGFHGGLNQQWYVTRHINGYYTITNVLTGKALDIPSGSPVPGVKVQQYTYHGGPNQQWKIGTSLSSGISRIHNRQTGLALDIPYGSIATGEKVQQYTPNSGLNQTWTFKLVGYILV